MSLFGLGAKRSHPDKLAKMALAARHPKIAAGGVVPASLQSFEPPCLDQGGSGSCTAHSAAAGVATALAAAEKPLAFIPSPKDLYAPTRALERAMTTPDGQTLPGLTDSGAELADVVTVLATYGVAPMKGPTPDGRNSDVWTDADTGGSPAANINDEPNTQELEEAGTELLVGPYNIPIDENALATCATAIATGFPIYVAFFCDLAFQGLQPGQVGVAPTGDPNNPQPGEGGHAVVCTAVDTGGPGGTRRWRIKNSWGASWCDAGACYVSDAWVLAAWELIVLDVKLAETMP